MIGLEYKKIKLEQIDEEKDKLIMSKDFILDIGDIIGFYNVKVYKKKLENFQETIYYVFRTYEGKTIDNFNESDKEKLKKEIPFRENITMFSYLDFSSTYVNFSKLVFEGYKDGIF